MKKNGIRESIGKIEKENARIKIEKEEVNENSRHCKIDNL